MLPSNHRRVLSRRLIPVDANRSMMSTCNCWYVGLEYRTFMIEAIPDNQTQAWDVIRLDSDSHGAKVPRKLAKIVLRLELDIAAR